MANNQQLARTDQLRNALIPIQKTINALLVDPQKAKRFMAAAFHVANDASLEKCSTESIAQAIVGVAMLDLNIDGNMGHAYLVPYRGKAQLQIGYKGWIQLLFRSGWVIKTFPIFKCDIFELKNDGWDTHVNYIPDIDGQDEGDETWVLGNLRGIYVVARNKQTGDEFARFASKSLIEKLRLLSSNQAITDYTKPVDRDRLQNGLPVGIWQGNYVEMSIAKATKKLAKLLPIGDSTASLAMVVDDKSDIGRVIDYQKTIEQGMVVEQEEAVLEESVLSATDILNRINQSESIADLEALIDDIKTLSKEDIKIARAAYGAKQKELKPKPTEVPEAHEIPDVPAELDVPDEEVDWQSEIKAAKTSADLKAIYERMPEMDQIHLFDLFVEKDTELGG